MTPEQIQILIIVLFVVVGAVGVAYRPLLPRWQRLADGHENPWEGDTNDELGTVRSDLTAFAALLLCMALVALAIWAASGW